MISILKKICNTLDTVYLAIACILLVCVLSACSIQVFTRYILNAALVGTEEVARYTFVWMSMLGSSICIGRWSHPSVTVIIDNLKGAPRKLVKILIYLAILVCTIVFIRYGIQMVQATQTQISPTLRIPMWIPYLAIPVGGVGMLFHTIVLLAETIFEKEEVKE